VEPGVIVEGDWVAIGRLWRARGNRGELLGELDSSEPGREDQLREVALVVGGQRRLLQVQEVWRHDGRPVFKFVGVDSISDAEKLEGAEILVPASEVAKPAEGAYSHQELVGCRVETLAAAGGMGALLGVVTGVEEYGGPPLLQVKAEDGREILIPFVRAICKEIDVAAKRIRAELPEGLLEYQ
jgi:16S rRNA processing protein RimM